MWTLKDLKEIVEDKFIKTKPFDVETGLNEIETTKAFIEQLKKYNIAIKTLNDIPYLFYLLRYSDDEFTTKLLSQKHEDLMQTARATIYSLKGDCEDIHRFYNAVAIALGEKVDNVNLIVVFFGNKDKIIGAHATSIIDEKILTDYQAYVYTNSLKGILSYLSDIYFPIYAYVMLSIELKDGFIHYKYKKSDVFDNKDYKYSLQVATPTKAINELRHHLYRNSEYESKTKVSNFLKFGSIATLSYILGKIL
ncbi:hypothetical protein X275_08220 [Marinitoga sp. 1197]|uniref:hypothetical protein n=1 Tax=Marinitoga sp. 1197 TaxID=1428449 RepID=UPI00064114A9|nr:hypothetical protein [Marinitoga sp. 1197]KLO21867.1 hypothetical protein X275_08220 [Marinitoga sp. 1197]